MRTTRSLIFNLRLFRQCLLLGFLLTPVMAVGQVPDFEDTLRAAGQGDALAQYHLGIMYDNGAGVPQDHAEAAKWYRLAADQGDARALAALGGMYALGVGVPRDYVTAYVLLNIAAASGNEDAINARPIVEQQMTGSQVSEAQRLSREIFERIQGNQ